MADDRDIQVELQKWVMEDKPDGSMVAEATWVQQVVPYNELSMMITPKNLLDDLGDDENSVIPIPVVEDDFEVVRKLVKKHLVVLPRMQQAKEEAMGVKRQELEQQETPAFIRQETERQRPRFEREAQKETEEINAKLASLEEEAQEIRKSEDGEARKTKLRVNAEKQATLKTRRAWVPDSVGKKLEEYRKQAVENYIASEVYKVAEEHNKRINGGDLFDEEKEVFDEVFKDMPPKEIGKWLVSLVNAANYLDAPRALHAINKKLAELLNRLPFSQIPEVMQGRNYEVMAEVRDDPQDTPMQAERKQKKRKVQAKMKAAFEHNARVKNPRKFVRRVEVF